MNLIGIGHMPCFLISRSQNSNRFQPHFPTSLEYSTCNFRPVSNQNFDRSSFHKRLTTKKAYVSPEKPEFLLALLWKFSNQPTFLPHIQGNRGTATFVPANSDL